MPARNLGQPARVGKRWPYRFLNFLPPGQLRRFLAWRSGSGLVDSPFEVRKALSSTDRILLVMPEEVSTLLIALPVVKAHFQALPEAAIWLLASPLQIPFLASLFGHERILPLDPDQFYLGEEHFKDLEGRLKGMRPDLVVNFRGEAPPLLQSLLRSTMAPVRVQLGSVSQHFANVVLAPGDPPNHLRHFQMAARLWDAAGIPLSGKWTRLDPTADSRSRAGLLLKSAGLKPETTWLFPWQDASGDDQSNLLKEVASAARTSGNALAVLQCERGLFATPVPPPEIASAYPCLKTDTPGTLLALFAGTGATVGRQGPLLLLAGLTDATVTGYFREEDAPFDTSSMNPRLRVVWLGRAGGVARDQ